MGEQARTRCATRKSVRRFFLGIHALPDGGTSSVWRVGTNATSSSTRFVGQIADISLIPEALHELEVFNQTGWE